MKMELAASGLSEEEILHKTQLLMKAFGKEEVGSTAEYKLLSKQKNKALIKAEIPPKDFSAVSRNTLKKVIINKIKDTNLKLIILFYKADPSY